MQITFPKNQIFTSPQKNTDANNINGNSANNKKTSVLDALLKQKKDLTDSKNALVDRTLKNGDSLDSIKDTLKTIDDQIKEINIQITAATAEEQQKKLGTDEKTKQAEKAKSSNSSSGSKKSDTLTINMENMLSISTNLNKIHVFTAEKKSMENQTTILNSQIKLDRGRGLDPVRKENEVAEMSEKMRDLAGGIGDNLNIISNKSKINTTEVNEALTPMQQRAEQDIQVYTNNLPENAVQDGENVNIEA